MDSSPLTTNNHGMPNLDLPSSSTTAVKDKKSLAIALIVATVFLLASVAVTAWLFVQKAGGNSIITKIDPNSTVNVTKVSWVAPTLPAGFKTYNQSTNDSEIVYYANTADGCSVTTRVMPAEETSDLAKMVAETNDTNTIKTKTLAETSAITLKDVDGQRQYNFKGTEFDQTVSNPTTDYTGLSGVAYYKQFGHDLATLSFVCKTANFNANTDLLGSFVEKFNLKTER